MHTSSWGAPRPVIVLGTVMGVRRDGDWFVHDVEATGPDGRRIKLQVTARQRHRGGVSVKWDPSERIEPRFVVTRPWGLYALTALVVIAVVVVAVLVL